MIDKRLFQLTNKRPLVLLVAFRLFNLGLSITLWYVLASQMSHYLSGEPIAFGVVLFTGLGVLAGKFIIAKLTETQTYQASANLRISMRQAVMEKAFRLGNSAGQLPASQLSQYSVEGIEQLEIYYARFLPQLFYCLLASLCIFGILAGFAWQPALVLLVCMPLIPIVIMAVMKIAKKILASYWSRYTNLGSKFHENLSGLSVLKAYNRDEAKQVEIAEDAERFRKVTMSLLSMQLNSITIMDIVSYSGAALGIGFALLRYIQGDLSTTGALMFLLLSAEFFLPMRQLGSLFHVAMNGISACKKLFTYLELPEQAYGPVETFKEPLEKIEIKELDFRYIPNSDSALKNISATFEKGKINALVGKSGSGKSTFVRVLMHQLSGYEGEILWNQLELGSLSADLIRQSAILVDNHGYLYAQSIRENLSLAKADVTDAEIWQVLEKVSLKSFVAGLPNQLEECLSENGANLSGGQRQRLLLARALLSEAQLFIFDEITSGVDLESEEIILTVLAELAKEKIVLFISHRLYNVRHADQVLVFDEGRIIEQGTPAALSQDSTFYQNYFAEETKLMGGEVE